MKVMRWVLGLGAVGAAAEYGIARYFFRRTLIRENAATERTTNMSGTNWDNYIPSIKKNRIWMERQTKEDVYIESRDGLKLHATWFPSEGSRKIVIGFHGYTGEGMKDFTSLGRFYLRSGYSLLLVDARAHGESEGRYIGFGCLDRWDALEWVRYIGRRQGEDCEVILHGVSMGGATVLMTSGLNLPGYVKAIVSDCAFTSAWEVFTSVLHTTYHMPAFPIMQIADGMAKREAGYGLNECNAKEVVKKAKVPILFIHGSEDTFVPCGMCHEIYRNCASRREIMIVDGAGHAEAYYKEPRSYEAKISEFLTPGGEGQS